MRKNLIDEKSIVKYLVDKKILLENEGATVEVLPGGVSNIVFAITTKSKQLVLKQALKQLKVSENWQADQHRAIIEGKAIKLFHSLTPNEVPNLIFLDEERYIVVLKRTAIGSSVWKNDLLSGFINLEIADKLGQTLRKWHDFGHDNVINLKEFDQDNLFDQLRIDPFYRFVAAKNPLISGKINYLIGDLIKNKSSIVHGDFSPKNIMVTPYNKICILDYETTHLGNPVFDLAFLLAHLLCKHIHARQISHAKLLKKCANRFLDAYGSDHYLQMKNLGLHTALITLARVEGKSPVNYLSQLKQKEVVAITKAVLSSNSLINPLNLFKR
jgi:5-methylthioribose kinase